MEKKDNVTTPVSRNTATGRSTSQVERRTTRRCKITQLMRLQPSDPEKTHFEDLRSSANVSRSGAYFHTTEDGYEVGLRLFLTMPFSRDPAALNREYLAEVVRKDLLANGMSGVAVKILLEMGMRQGYTFSTPVGQNR